VHCPCWRSEPGLALVLKVVLMAAAAAAAAAAAGARRLAAQTQKMTGSILPGVLAARAAAGPVLGGHGPGQVGRTAVASRLLDAALASEQRVLPRPWLSQQETI
jgi:hypothetical protein